MSDIDKESAEARLLEAFAKAREGDLLSEAIAVAREAADECAWAHQSAGLYQYLAETTPRSRQLQERWSRSQTRCEHTMHELRTVTMRAMFLAFAAGRDSKEGADA